MILPQIKKKFSRVCYRNGYGDCATDLFITLSTNYYTVFEIQASGLQKLKFCIIIIRKCYIFGVAFDHLLEFLMVSPVLRHTVTLAIIILLMM